MQPPSNNWKLKKKLSSFSLIKTLKRLLFQQSHLSPYLPLMKEGLQAKIMRLHQDGSSKSNVFEAGQHEHENAKNDNEFLYNLIFTQKQCYDPLMNLLIPWYVLVFFAIVYAYVEVGLILTYGENAWENLYGNPISISLNIYCLLVFLGDILVQFNTGYLSRGVIITEKARVVSNYLRSYLIPDVLLALITLISLISSDYYLNIVRLIVVTKLARMLEIDELLIRKISTAKTLKISYVIGKQFITIFILSHTIGLFFYAIDFALTNDPGCLQNNSLCWLYSATAYSPILNYDWQIQYFYTLYWGLNTIATISYGDIAPNNPSETVYALFCMCFGFIVYGYVVNNIIKILLWARRTNDNFKHELILYTTFMDNLKINKPEQYELREYLEHQYLEQKERNLQIEEEMKSRLPESLRDELLKSAYIKVYNHFEYFFQRSPSITKLLYFLEERKCTENEVILRQGANLAGLYYLHQGQVQLTNIFGQTLHFITKVDSSDTFLSHYEYFLSERASYSITTTRTCTIYFLQKEKIDEQLLKYTDLRENFKMIEYELRLDFNHKKIFYKCFYCRSSHHWYQCTEYFPNFSNISLFKFQPEISLKRFARPSHKTWRDRSKLLQIMKINKNPSFILLQRMKQRIYGLKKMKIEMKKYFDVDVCYEWQFYLPTCNLSVFKSEWNNNAIKNKTRSKGQLSKLLDLNSFI